MLRVPAESAAPSVIVWLAFERVRGDALERVSALSELAPLVVTDWRVSASVPVTVSVCPATDTVLIPAPAMIVAPVRGVPLPVIERTPVLFKVVVPPNATVPPPDNPVPAVTVIEELTSEAFPI